MCCLPFILGLKWFYVLTILNTRVKFFIEKIYTNPCTRKSENLAIMSTFSNQSY